MHMHMHLIEAHLDPPVICVSISKNHNFGGFRSYQVTTVGRDRNTEERHGKIYTSS